MIAYRTEQGEILHPHSWRDGEAIVEGWALAAPGSEQAEAWKDDARPLPERLRPLVERLRVTAARP